MITKIFILSLFITQLTCQPKLNTDKVIESSESIDTSTKIILQDPPNNLKDLLKRRDLKRTKQKLQEDEFLGLIKIRLENKTSLDFMQLKDFVSQDVSREKKFGIPAFENSEVLSDSGEELIKFDNSKIEVLINPSYNSYQSFRIKSKGLAVVSLNGYEIRIGSTLDELEDHFPTEVGKAKQVKRNNRLSKSVKLELNSFINQSSDYYLRIFADEKDRIFEIESWSQY